MSKQQRTRVVRGECVAADYVPMHGDVRQKSACEHLEQINTKTIISVWFIEQFASWNQFIWVKTVGVAQKNDNRSASRPQRPPTLKSPDFDVLRYLGNTFDDLKLLHSITRDFWAARWYQSTRINMFEMTWKARINRCNIRTHFKHEKVGILVLKCLSLINIDGVLQACPELPRTPLPSIPDNFVISKTMQSSASSIPNRHCIALCIPEDMLNMNSYETKCQWREYIIRCNQHVHLHRSLSKSSFLQNGVLKASDRREFELELLIIAAYGYMLCVKTK